MRRIVRPALLFFAFAEPSAAQPPHVGGIAYEPSRGPSIMRQVDRIDDRVDRARRNGEIGRREARAMEREARLIGRLRGRYAHAGLSEGERRELQARIDYLEGSLAAKRTRGVRKGRNGL
jgi:hypothetical protein